MENNAIFLTGKGSWMLLNCKDKVEKKSTIHKTYAMEAKKLEMSGP